MGAKTLLSSVVFVKDNSQQHNKSVSFVLNSLLPRHLIRNERIQSAVFLKCVDITLIKKYIDK